MKALSLTAPWAHLCVAPDPADAHVAVKPIETRSWRVSAGLPMRIAIHAAKGIDALTRRHITRADLPRPSKFVDPYARALGRAGLSLVDPWLPNAQERFDAIPLGAIIGTVTLVRCIRTERVGDDVSDLVRQLGLFTPGRWAWMLCNPTRFAHPIPCRGMQGLWKVDPATAVQCAALDPRWPKP